MRLSKTLDLLNQIEKRFPVTEWRIGEVHIWPIIRLDLSLALQYNDRPDLQQKIDIKYKIKQAIRISSGFVEYLKSSIIDKGHNDKINHRDIVFLSDSDLRIKLDQKWYDRLCEPLISELGNTKYSSLVLETSSRYRTPRSNSSKYVQPWLDFSLLKTVALSRRVNHFESNHYSVFIDFLKEMELNIPLPTTDRISSIYNVIQAYAQIYENYLKRVNPKVAMVVGYYGPRGLAFNLACNRLNIPSVDIQHGVQGNFHAAYGRWLKVPKTGFALLPNYFFCWSKEEVNVINAWRKSRINNHRPLEVGNPFLTLWHNSNHPIVKTYDKRIKKTIGSRPNILVTLSYNHGDYSTLEETLKVIQKTQRQWKYWIRLHPDISMIRQRKPLKSLIQNSGIVDFEYEQATSLPLYALLRFMDLHITHFSSSVLEASQFGIPSIITSEDGADIFKTEIESKRAFKAVSATNILQTAQRILNRSQKTKSLSSLNHSRRNANRQRFFRNILSHH